MTRGEGTEPADDGLREVLLGTRGTCSRSEGDGEVLGRSMEESEPCEDKCRSSSELWVDGGTARIVDLSGDASCKVASACVGPWTDADADASVSVSIRSGCSCSYGVGVPRNVVP